MKVNDYQKKRVDRLEGYYASCPTRKDLYTVLVMGVDGQVTEFDNIFGVQMVMLWQAFDQADNVEKYVIIEGRTEEKQGA